MDKLQEDEDYILLKRFNYSIRDVLERYPDGVPDHLIAQALGIEEDEVQLSYADVVRRLQEIMKVEQT